MASQVARYLSDLRGQLHLAAAEEREILTEIRDHIQDSTEELLDEGIYPDDAMSSAINDMGATKRIARQMYEVHTHGSWYHTALAVLPHVLLSALFALGLWKAPGWLALLLALALMISIFGWRKGRPTWTYPWLGYCLVAPIVSWGLAVSALGYGAWGVLTQGSLPLGIPIYLISLVYIAGSLLVALRIVTRVAQGDWVMASLTVLPAPFLVYWFLFFYNRQEFLPAEGNRFQGVDASAAMVFLLIAGATALFFRISRRMVRAVLLATTIPLVVALAGLSFQGGTGYMPMVTLAATSVVVLLGPALLGQRAGRAEDQLLEHAG